MCPINISNRKCLSRNLYDPIQLDKTETIDLVIVIVSRRNDKLFT